jgi:quercetin dioxygenase-like cupin family protein
MDKNENIIFPKWEKSANHYFTWEPWVQNLVPADNWFNCPIYNVTFEAWVRNNWHKHAGWQILLVTYGVWYYQEKWKAIKEIKKWDVVLIWENVEHWHWATPSTSMTHIAISTNIDKWIVEWWNPVTDDEFTSYLK